VSRLLAKHQQRVLDMQLLQQRIAWSAIELYAMAAVIGKLQSMLEHAEGNGGIPHMARDLVVGKGYCRHAAGRIARRLRGLFRNRDKVRLAVADAVLKEGT
jgi:alkylation response protein AidB-like acyl-CoA dehydrogenase